MGGRDGGKDEAWLWGTHPQHDRPLPTVSFTTGSQPDFMKTERPFLLFKRWALWDSQKEKAFLKCQIVTINTREPVLKDRARVSLKGADSDGLHFKNGGLPSERQHPLS